MQIIRDFSRIMEKCINLSPIYIADGRGRTKVISMTQNKDESQFIFLLMKCPSRVLRSKLHVKYQFVFSSCSILYRFILIASAHMNLPPVILVPRFRVSYLHSLNKLWMGIIQVAKFNFIPVVFSLLPLPNE